VAVDVEATDGRRVRGYAGDNLAPKRFDKDPSKSFRDNIKDELAAIRIAHQAYLEAAKVPRCKGIFKSFLNRSLVERWNGKRKLGAHLFMTAEDLTTLSVIPLLQDLATARAFGITRVERNGHHYVKGLAHCSPRERKQATRLHRDLYRRDDSGARLRIESGFMRVGSRGLPGYGGPSEPDLSSMTPLERWTFDSLESKS
jgi:hypothetical protein